MQCLTHATCSIYVFCYCDYYFPSEGTETQRVEVTSLRSHSLLMLGQTLELKSLLVLKYSLNYTTNFNP